MAQLNETPTNIKAPPRTADVSVLRNYVADLADILAKLSKDLDFIINGNLDVKNIRANSITADRMDVDELSAISANLGTIIAGIIYGTYIATSESDYPRAEMRSSDQMFKVAQSSTNYAEFVANYSSGGGNNIPALRFVKPGDYMEVGGIGPGGVFGMLGYNDLYLLAYGRIYQFLTYFPDWTAIRNNSNGKSLDQELQEIRSTINALITIINNKADKETST